jgi:hypothetical protein
MDRIAGTTQLGNKNAERGSRDKTAGTGQLERTVGTGQLWQDSHGRKNTTGWQEKTAGIGQPKLDNSVGTARTGQPE